MSKNLIVDLNNQNQLNYKKQELIRQQSKKGFWELISDLVYQAIDWQLWYLLMLILVFSNLYLIYFHKSFKASIKLLKIKILFIYYAFMFNLASKKNNLVKARMIAKKILELNIADQNFLNTLQQILYNT